MNPSYKIFFGPNANVPVNAPFQPSHPCGPSPSITTPSPLRAAISANNNNWMPAPMQQTPINPVPAPMQFTPTHQRALPAPTKHIPSLDTSSNLHSPMFQIGINPPSHSPQVVNMAGQFLADSVAAESWLPVTKSVPNPNHNPSIPVGPILVKNQFFKKK